jgi:Fur family ferric uptake transcriptional regulator
MASAQEIIEGLRERGIRLTIQRRLVIEVLCELGGHVTVQEIGQRLRQQGIEINETTVYRILQWLKEIGLVSQTDLGRSELVYELVGEHPHHHLVCLSCGAIIDIDYSLLIALGEQIRREYGFEPRMDHMAIFGQCQRCRSGHSNGLPPKK